MQTTQIRSASAQRALIVNSRSRQPSRRLNNDEIPKLVAAAAAGDQNGWNTLVTEFGGLIWAIARTHRLSKNDASEVAQVTWLNLFEHLDELDDPSRVGPWLATTARRECVRALRTNDRHVLLDADAPEQESPDAPLDESLLIRERDEALWRCVGCLRQGDRELLRLLFADPSPTYEEISAALDMPIGSIGPTRQRALQRLRHELDTQGTLALIAD